MLPSAVHQLLPTPTAADSKQSGGAQGSSNVTLTDAVIRGRGASPIVLFPTPDASAANHGESVESWKARRERVKAKGINGNGMGMPLCIAALELAEEIVLLQTPSVADAMGGHERRGGARSGELLLKGQAKEIATDWGKYEPAVRRWEPIIGRPAPSPVEPNTRDGYRLSARFDEWLMGCEEGWITDTPGITWNDKIKACGNGVVPQQAAAALADMLAAFGAQGVAA